MSFLKLLFVIVVVAGLGALGALLAFFPDRFRAWASDHLDRNKTTGEAMFDLTPRTSIWDFSEAPNWYYRIFGSIMLFVSLFLTVGFILAALRGFPE